MSLLVGKCWQYVAITSSHVSNPTLSAIVMDVLRSAACANRLRVSLLTSYQGVGVKTEKRLKFESALRHLVKQEKRELANNCRGTLLSKRRTEIQL